MIQAQLMNRNVQLGNMVAALIMRQRYLQPDAVLCTLVSDCVQDKEVPRLVQGAQALYLQMRSIKNIRAGTDVNSNFIPGHKRSTAHHDHTIKVLRL